MRILNASKVATPEVEELRLGAPISTPGGDYCAPLHIGRNPIETLGLQLGPARIGGIVQTSRVCYMDLELAPAQIEWIKRLESRIRDQLPGHTVVWFTRDMQAEDINYFYDTSIQGNKLRARVQRCASFDTVDLQVFEESGQLGSIELVQGETTVLALVSVQGVSHRSGRIGLDWVVQQVLVKREHRCKINLGEQSEGKTEEVDIEAVADETTVEATETLKAAEPLPPPPPLPVAALSESTPSEVIEMPITEVDAVLPAGDTLTLRSEADLVADELEQQTQDERDRRHVALQMFMEANGLDPAAYYFPDTDEEDDEDDADLSNIDNAPETHALTAL